MYTRLLLISIIGFVQSLVAQKNYVFTKGLFVNGAHHYGREALYTDSLAYQLYNQTPIKPEPGKIFGQAANGEAILWKEAMADSNNLFRSRRFGAGGYLYLTYTSGKEENVLLNIKGNSAVYFNGVLHAGDPYSAGMVVHPVKLKKGDNELYIRTGFQTSASILFPEKPVMISTADSTMPHIVLNKQAGVFKGRSSNYKFRFKRYQPVPN
jgi:hypothetical protein